MSFPGFEVAGGLRGAGGLGGSAEGLRGSTEGVRSGTGGLGSLIESVEGVARLEHLGDTEDLEGVGGCGYPRGLLGPGDLVGLGGLGGLQVLAGVQASRFGVRAGPCVVGGRSSATSAADTGPRSSGAWSAGS